MNEIRISCPGKIMDHRSNKSPRGFTSFRFGFFCTITMTVSLRILQITRSSNNIIFINIYCNIKVTPNTMKLSPNVGFSIPSIVVIFSHLRVPLTHRKSDPFFRVSTSSTNHFWNLTFKVKSKCSIFSWQ